MKKIKSALISVFHKDGLEPIVKRLNELNVQIISTGGTEKFIKDLGIKVRAVEDLTSYPSILGGRVKTLHPKVFGGILARRDVNGDVTQLEEYEIPEIDLVIVDLYPFEETVANTTEEQEIIEKIDIGGISLIRAAAKNFKDTLIVSERTQYESLLQLLNEKQGFTSLDDRKLYASKAFDVSSHYDTAIFHYFNTTAKQPLPVFKESNRNVTALRYGENPHQEGNFFGNLDEIIEQLHGKQISYNNLVDIDAAVQLIAEFSETTFAILKHNNACGLAEGDTVVEAWEKALAGDPVSAFGGILVSNRKIDLSVAEEINKIFFEVIIAPGYDEEALQILKQKKNRIILILKEHKLPLKQFRSLLNGILEQDRDTSVEESEDFKVVTEKNPEKPVIKDLEFANKIVKHTKSNAIVLVKNRQLIGSGMGQTSRVDALKQAIAKAKAFNFELKGAVMASDAFFPFSDCVEIADKEGVQSVIQPGGSIRDQESVDHCNKHDMSMVLTGVRHFKH